MSTAPNHTADPTNTPVANVNQTSTNGATAHQPPAAPASHATPTFAIPSGPVPGPVDLLKSELGRLINLRSTWVYFAAIVAFLVGLPLLMWLGTQGGPAEFAFEPSFSQLLVGTDFAIVIAVVFAAAGSAAEISGRRVAFTYLSANGRTGPHLARMCAQVIVVAVAVLVSFAVLAAFFAAIGVLVNEDLGNAIIMICLALVWTAIGSAVGMLIPSTAVAASIPLAWIMVLELAVSAAPIDFLQTVSKYLPWIASRQLADLMDIGVTDLHAGLVLATWVIVLIGGGIAIASRRDVK